MIGDTKEVVQRMTTIIEEMTHIREVNKNHKIVELARAAETVTRMDSKWEETLSNSSSRSNNRWTTVKKLSQSPTTTTTIIAKSPASTNIQLTQAETTITHKFKAVTTITHQERLPTTIPVHKQLWVIILTPRSSSHRIPTKASQKQRKSSCVPMAMMQSMRLSVS